MKQSFGFRSRITCFILLKDYVHILELTKKLKYSFNLGHK